MGLVDVLNGMRNGPRGQQGANPSSGGMSPIMMAILGLLAYKAIKHIGSGQQAAPANPSAPANTTPNSGGLGGALGGTLGGLLAGGAAGSVLSGGLSDLLNHLQQNGLGEEANSWVRSGPNKSVSPNDLANALGADRVNMLTAQTGLSRDELLRGLSEQLPDAVNQLTPDGQIPSEHEVNRML